jgi:hypothetical protein
MSLDADRLVTLTRLTSAVPKTHIPNTPMVCESIHTALSNFSSKKTSKNVCIISTYS